MKRTVYPCPVCGAPLHLRSRENEADPYLLTDPCVLHHSCLVTLKAMIEEFGLPDNEHGARQAIAALHEAVDGMRTHPPYAWDRDNRRQPDEWPYADEVNAHYQDRPYVIPPYER